MKQLIFATVFLFAGFSFAETVTEDISSLRKWKAVKVSDHTLMGEDACMASTVKSGHRLEVYSAKKGEKFAEPTIHAILNDLSEDVYRGKIRFNSGETFTMTYASREGMPEGVQSLMVRFEDREEIVRLIRAKNTARVDSYNSEGQRVNRTTFSLSGSSRTVRSQFENCDLKFENLEL